MSHEERRVYAADWFIRAAAMPCGLILAAFYLNEPPRSVNEFLLNFLLIVAGPAVIAGGWGAALGVAILDPAATRSAGRAALRGLGVAGASFVTYLFVICFFLSGFGFDPQGSFFVLFLLFFIYGSILVGWLVALVGALAGALLYRQQEGGHTPA